jgi:hypothetical protein
MWLQRSRVSWLKYGDRNTSYFHRQAQWRARKNKIKKLKRLMVLGCETPQEMKQMVVQYFADLYSAEQEVQPNRVLHLIEPKITQEMNEDLCRHFIEKEISDALFQMRPLKAPGPDGFPAYFFQRHWGIVKEDVIAAVKQFFTNGIFPAEINDTLIVLIPKGIEPEEIKDFRPISLCNVIYKLISKCLVNRLWVYLAKIISPEQSALCLQER